MYVKILRPLLVASLVAFPALAQDPGTTLEQDPPSFVSVIDDLPLMEQLAETGDGVQFSTSQGRIAEATAQGSVSKSDVLAFYNNTLPQLGWTKVDAAHFTREGETLELVFERLDGVLNVRFALAPAATQK